MSGFADQFGLQLTSSVVTSRKSTKPSPFTSPFRSPDQATSTTGHHGDSLKCVDLGDVGLKHGGRRVRAETARTVRTRLEGVRGKGSRRSVRDRLNCTYELPEGKRRSWYVHKMIAHR